MRLTERVGAYIHNWETTPISVPTVAVCIYLHFFYVGLFICAPERNRRDVNSWIEFQHLPNGQMHSWKFGIARDYEALLRKQLRSMTKAKLDYLDPSRVVYGPALYITEFGEVWPQRSLA